MVLERSDTVFIAKGYMGRRYVPLLTKLLVVDQYLHTINSTWSFPNYTTI